MKDLLNIQNLTVSAEVGGETRTVVDSLDMTIGEGEAVGLVGESGSGKSITAKSILRLQAKNISVSGRIEFNGEDIVTMKPKRLQRLRRADVSMIFQDPRAAINPVRSIGQFLTEALMKNQRLSRAAAISRALEAMRAVGIGRPEDRLAQYPHEFSGGMLQRIMICSTLLTDSRLLLADEPTTALDMTTQAEVIAILDKLRRERGLSVLFITHDLDLATAICDRINVMFAGRILEDLPASDIEHASTHPYTQALFAARPSLDRRVATLPTISGSPLAAFELDELAARGGMNAEEIILSRALPGAEGASVTGTTSTVTEEEGAQ